MKRIDKLKFAVIENAEILVLLFWAISTIYTFSYALYLLITNV